MIDLRQLEADALTLAPMLAREIAALEASTAEIDLRQLQADALALGPDLRPQDGIKRKATRDINPSKKTPQRPFWGVLEALLGRFFLRFSKCGFILARHQVSDH